LARRNVFLVVLLAASCTAGCAARGRPAIADSPVMLNGHQLRLHFANPAQGRLDAGSPPLLVFATGDGGMRRKDLDTYRHLVESGYPIVGFDARDYVTHLGAGATTTPARLAADYQRIIDTARQVLHVSAAYPVVRGVTVDVYEYLPHLGDLPLAVIQSTRDNYLPADAARALFGPDTAHRRFQAIDAGNHSFKGARTELYDAMRAAVAWVCLSTQPKADVSNRSFMQIWMRPEFGR
jgi:virulence protein VirJ